MGTQIGRGEGRIIGLGRGGNRTGGIDLENLTAGFARDRRDTLEQFFLNAISPEKGAS